MIKFFTSLLMKKCLFILVVSALPLSFIALTAQEMPKREMRAVWIATVENIDWPSSATLSSSQQKSELIALLDHVKAYNLNTVVFQIRPAADAFYSSKFEPWSQWLTGEQGKAPEPYYDPLDFIIKECRKRGLDVHAWLNPYRAVKDTGQNSTSPGHITNRHPEWFLNYGQTRYFDPALPEARDYVAQVVSDLVRRYDVDAIHMDDYFYPYRIAGQQFPDDSSFAKHSGPFSLGNRDDWRRNNVDFIIQQLADSIKKVKPWVEFGISPFGVWRNASRDTSGSATKAGQTNYDDLFADVLKWQKKGWIDYVVPQLYWHIGFSVADYEVLAGWWNRNAFGCPLYIGQAFYRIDKKSTVKAWRSSKEITRQIALNRQYENINGSMFFSAKYLRTSPLKLRQNMLKVYPYKALTPVNDRINATIPEPPENARIIADHDSIMLNWTKNDGVKHFVVYKFRIGHQADRSNPETIFCITADSKVAFPNKCRTNLRKHYYVVTSLSRGNVESGPVYFRRVTGDW